MFVLFYFIFVYVISTMYYTLVDVHNKQEWLKVANRYSSPSNNVIGPNKVYNCKLLDIDITSTIREIQIGWGSYTWQIKALVHKGLDTYQIEVQLGQW